MLVEKDRICGGTTGNTTAKITVQHGLIYDKVLKSNGVEAARLYLKANKAAFGKYRELAAKIDCDYEIKDNFVYSQDRNKLFREMNALSIIGSEAKLYDSLPIPVSAAGAVCFPNQAQFHPLKFLSVISKDLRIYENTFIKELEKDKARGDFGEIRAEKIIVTTHFPFINKHGSYFLKLYQHRSYVIALENAPDFGGMYVDDDKKGFSFRNYNELLLLGGGSHKTGKKGGNWEELRKFAKKNLQSSKEVYSWAAQDCMSLDGIPYIGRYSKNTPNMYTATGFNKWGMTGSMLSAMLLSDAVTDTENDFSWLFGPSRSILKPQLLVNGFEAAVNLLTVSNKRCPHLGCALKWNSAEHSWDCPCHGSRFTKEGRVIENPANGNIKK